LKMNWAAPFGAAGLASDLALRYREGKGAQAFIAR
jgi:hypothetical protein